MIHVGTPLLDFGKDCTSMLSLFSGDVVKLLQGYKIAEIKINKWRTLVIWRASVIKIFDKVNDDKLCTIVDFSTKDRGSDQGEGFAIIDSDAVEYKFLGGDIVAANRLFFCKKSEPEPDK